MGDTAARQRRQFDIDIVDLAEAHVAPTAWIHATCFPEKIESLLGRACIEDCLRRRYIQPHGDCYARVAVLRETGAVVGYCYAERFKNGNKQANMFLSRRIARAHLLRRIWFSPRIWWWLAGRVGNRIFHRGWNEGDRQVFRDDWEVAKMLGLHPDFRGGNVGVDLMLDNENEARRRGSKRITGLVLRENVKAERLYKSIGWVRTSADSQHYLVFAMHKDLEAAPVDAPVAAGSAAR